MNLAIHARSYEVWIKGPFFVADDDGLVHAEGLTREQAEDFVKENANVEANP